MIHDQQSLTEKQIKELQNYAMDLEAHLVFPLLVKNNRHYIVKLMTIFRLEYHLAKSVLMKCYSKLLQRQTRNLKIYLVSIGK